MNHLKRLLSVLLCAALLFCLAACGKEDDAGTTAPDTGAVTETEDPAQEPETPADPELPEVPAEPDTPAEPEAPAEPELPETPEVPDETPEAPALPDAATEDQLLLLLPDGSVLGTVTAYLDDYLTDVTAVSIGGAQAMLVNLTIEDLEMRCVELSFSEDGQTMHLNWWGLYHLALHLVAEVDEGYIIDDYEQSQGDATEFFSGTRTLHFAGDDATVDVVTFYEDMTCTVEENGTVYTALYAGTGSTFYLFIPVDEEITPLTGETMDATGGNCAYFLLSAYDYTLAGDDMELTASYNALLSADYLLRMT